MRSDVISVRLPGELTGRLRARARAAGEPVSTLIARLADEGLRMDAHPGIIFRDGPAGRRPALVRGPDVWEVIAVIRASPDKGQKAITAAAAQLNLPDSQVRIALDYYGSSPDQIDAWIEENERAADAARTAWETQQRLLA